MESAGTSRQARNSHMPRRPTLSNLRARESSLRSVRSIELEERSQRSRPASRSPGPSFTPLTSALSSKRRARPLHVANRLSNVDNMAVDHPAPPLPSPSIERGRHVKAKAAKVSSYGLAENSAIQSAMRRAGSRDPRHHTANKHSSTELGLLVERESRIPRNTSHEDRDMLRSLAEVDRLKKEIELVKKQAYDYKKTIKKQNRTIEELKAEITQGSQALKEKDVQMQKQETKAKKSEDLLSSLEGSLQCQVCIDMLSKPYALAPCGHVLCQTCLQNWFRKAPATDDDMFDEDDPDYLVYRRKTCPCCRATVISRPVQLFIIKSIVGSIEHGKPSKGNSPPRGSPEAQDDPWVGLFPPVDAEGYYLSEDDGSDDEEDDDDEEDEDASDSDDDSVFQYGSESDAEPYEGGYVRARWEPPSVYVPVYGRGRLPHNINLLRRGVPIEMTLNDSLTLEYTHNRGISILVIDEGIRLYVGWNIVLSRDDLDGSGFVRWALEDVDVHEDRWHISDAVNGVLEYERLLREDEMEDYNTTDTEVWLEGSDDDDDEMGPI